MPIYEYQCPECGHVFEEWVHITDAPESRPCPQCGATAPHIISNTAFVLKGGGWYVTDYGYRKNASEGQDSSTPAPIAAAPAEAKETKATAPAPAATPVAAKSAPKKASKSAPASASSPAA